MREIDVNKLCKYKPILVEIDNNLMSSTACVSSVNLDRPIRRPLSKTTAAWMLAGTHPRTPARRSACFPRLIDNWK